MGQDGFRRWRAAASRPPARFGSDYGYRGTGGEASSTLQTPSMGFPSWEMPPPGDLLSEGQACSRDLELPGGRADGCARREPHGDPGSEPRSLHAPGRAGTTRRPPPQRGGGDAAGGGRGARGGEGVLARLGEVSGVVTETRQYGGDRPRPLA